MTRADMSINNKSQVGELAYLKEKDKDRNRSYTKVSVNTCTKPSI